MIGPRILKFLGSWWTTTALLLSVAVLYICFTFTENPYSGWIYFLSHTNSGLLVCIALIANLFFANLRIACDRMRRSPASPADIRAMDSFIEIPATGPDDLEKAADWMKKHGFTGEVRGNSINVRKENLSFLPGALMRTGLIVLITALLFSSHIRKTEEARLHEKETYAFTGSSISLNSIKTNLPDDFLQVGETGTLLLKEVSAVITSSGTSYTITSGFPARINGRYYLISDVGYSQALSLRSSGRKIEKLLDLNILPPGKADIVPLPSGDLFLTFTLQPEKTIRKGLLTGKQYLLMAPQYSIKIQRPEERPETVTLKPGDSFTQGDLSLALGKNSFFVKVTAVYDPALFWIYSGLLAALAGLMLMLSRFFWYKKQLSAVLADNTLLIGYSEEFFKKWGIQKFQAWENELLSVCKPAKDEPEPSQG